MSKLNKKRGRWAVVYVIFLAFLGSLSLGQLNYGTGIPIVLIQQETGPSSFPVLRAVGPMAAKAAACTPTLPAGTVDGDLLLMFVATANETAITVTDFTEVSCSPSGVNDAELAVFFNQWATGENLATSDSGNHQFCALVGFQTGTYDTTTEIDVCVASTQTATASKSITGGNTSDGFDFVLAGMGTDLPDANDTTEFSGEANANLASLTERMDDAKNTGTGGALLIITGELETAGATGSTTSTQEVSSDGGGITISINGT